MPIWVLLLGRCIWGERQPPKIYCSVIPIFIGIGMATISEINFNLIGTLSAFVSTIGFALQARISNFTFRAITFKFLVRENYSEFLSDYFCDLFDYWEMVVLKIGEKGLYTKKAMRELNMHQHLLLQYLTIYGILMMTPFWLVSGEFFQSFKNFEKFFRCTGNRGPCNKWWRAPNESNFDSVLFINVGPLCLLPRNLGLFSNLANKYSKL